MVVVVDDTEMLALVQTGIAAAVGAVDLDPFGAGVVDVELVRSFLQVTAGVVDMVEHCDVLVVAVLMVPEV